MILHRGEDKYDLKFVEALNNTPPWMGQVRVTWTWSVDNDDRRQAWNYEKRKKWNSYYIRSTRPIP